MSPPPAAIVAAGGVDSVEMIGVVRVCDGSVGVEQVALDAGVVAPSSAFLPLNMAALSTLFDPVANPTLRAPVLAAVNVREAKSGFTDCSFRGDPGKYSVRVPACTFPGPWEPLWVILRYGGEETAITGMATERRRRSAGCLYGDGYGVLCIYAASRHNLAGSSIGKVGQDVVIVRPEHAAALVESSISRAEMPVCWCDARQVALEEPLPVGELLEDGLQQYIVSESDGEYSSVRDPDDVVAVTDCAPVPGRRPLCPGLGRRSTSDLTFGGCVRCTIPFPISGSTVAVRACCVTKCDGSNPVGLCGTVEDRAPPGRPRAPSNTRSPTGARHPWRECPHYDQTVRYPGPQTWSRHCQHCGNGPGYGSF